MTTPLWQTAVASSIIAGSGIATILLTSNAIMRRYGETSHSPCSPQAYLGSTLNQNGGLQEAKRAGQKCMQSILTDVNHEAVKPIIYAQDVTTESINNIGNGIQSVRAGFKQVRDGVQAAQDDIITRTYGMSVQLVKDSIIMKSILQKVQAILAAVFYSIYSGLLALKSFLGAFDEAALTALIALVTTAIVLLADPFTIFMGIPVAALAVAVAIPLAIILYYVEKITKKTQGKMPRMP